MNWNLFAAFLVITTVLIVVPGPIVTLIIATGARQGLRAALVTVAGTSLGNVVLLAAIALGLGWVLRNAEQLFVVVRFVGAAYLIWLGIQAWRHAGAAESVETSGRVNFTRGVVVALSNPKTIAFFTAFLPQFVDPTLPAAPQLVVMCTVTTLFAALSDSAWAVASGMGRAWLMRPAQARLLARMSGAVLIGGGVWLSLARRTG
ncbi:MAG TPA: LysE family translocator [Xanthobacteraceae bacterium]|nr:LysE family translocator [Xanthobacteraceae bacterium]